MTATDSRPGYNTRPMTDTGAAAVSRRLSFWARMVLVPVAVIGAVLSFHSLYAAAVPTFGDYLAAGFPLLVDLLILGASVQYVAGAKIGRPMTGWRLTAHAGVAATLALNALAATKLGEVPWHVTAPAVWAVLVELTAKQVLGEWKATHTDRTDTISLTLWLTAPVESARTRLLMLRTGTTSAQLARTSVGVHAAAREALRLALPTRRGQRVRKIINRQLRAGSLPPAAILTPLGWTGTRALPDTRPETILRAVLHGVLHTSEPSGSAPDASVPPADDTSIAPVPVEASRDAGRTPRITTGQPAPAAKRQGGRPAGKTGTAATVAALHKRHPAWTNEQIADKAGVSVRTVRRYLNTTPTTTTAPDATPAPPTAVEDTSTEETRDDVAA